MSFLEKYEARRTIEDFDVQGVVEFLKWVGFNSCCDAIIKYQIDGKALFGLKKSQLQFWRGDLSRNDADRLLEFISYLGENPEQYIVKSQNKPAEENLSDDSFDSDPSLYENDTDFPTDDVKNDFRPSVEEKIAVVQPPEVPYDKPLPKQHKQNCDGNSTAAPLPKVLAHLHGNPSSKPSIAITPEDKSDVSELKEKEHAIECIRKMTPAEVKTIIQFLKVMQTVDEGNYVQLSKEPSSMMNEMNMFQASFSSADNRQQNEGTNDNTYLPMMASSKSKFENSKALPKPPKESNVNESSCTARSSDARKNDGLSNYDVPRNNAPLPYITSTQTDITNRNYNRVPSTNESRANVNDIKAKLERVFSFRPKEISTQLSNEQTPVQEDPPYVEPIRVSAQRGAVAQQRPRELPPIPNIPQILQEDSPVTSIMNNRITEDIFDMKNIEKHPSFHRVSRGDGLCMLQHKRNGTFLIRPSSQDSCYTLMLIFENKDFNMKISQRPDGRISITDKMNEGVAFSSLNNLINYYREGVEQLTLKFKNTILGKTYLYPV